MLRNNIGLLSVLPEDVILYLSIYFLGNKISSQLAQSSHFFNKLFSSPHALRDRIVHDFNMQPAWLSIIKEAQIKEATPFKEVELYKKIYKNLSFLQKKSVILPGRIKHTYSDPASQFLVLACCADNTEYMMETINPEETFLWFEMSLYAGCINIPKEIINQTHEDVFAEKKHIDNTEQVNEGIAKYIANFLGFISHANRIDMIRYLKDIEKDFAIKPTIDLLNHAAHYNHRELLLYYLDKSNNFNCDINQCDKSYRYDLSVYFEHCPLNQAIYYGHFALAKELLLLGAKPNEVTMHCAVHSENIEILKYFVEEHKLKPTQEDLRTAIIIGNQSVYEFFLQPEFALNPTEDPAVFAESRNLEFRKRTMSQNQAQNTEVIIDQKYLNNTIAASGNLASLQKILAWDNPLKLQPDAGTLHQAATSGNFDMVKYLLDPANHFALKPDHSTLLQAVFSGSLPLVRFLLCPENGYHIPVNGYELETGLCGVAITILLYSHSIFIEAIELLDENNKKAQNEFEEFNKMEQGRFTKKALLSICLARSFERSPRHFANMMLYALLHPTEYQLNASACQSLLETVQKMITEKDQFIDTAKHNKKFMLAIFEEMTTKLKENAQIISVNCGQDANASMNFKLH